MQQLSLLLLIIGIEEYELIRIEKNGILESIPPLLFEVLVVISEDVDVIFLLLLLITLETISSDFCYSHSYYL
jgi:hypothetical protein